MIIRLQVFFVLVIQLTRLSVFGNLANHDSNQVAIKVVQEPATVNYPANSATHLRNEELKVHQKPSNFSGPQFLKVLSEKCYNFSTEKYRFELCPFFNVTQHETSNLWNAYKGFIGSWLHWKIEDNKFVAMVFANGDSCGDVEREATVYLHCGTTDGILNVTEPEKCNYRLDFSTPFFCTENSLLVYPTLEEELRDKWDLLQTERNNTLITEKGYQFYLEKIFLEAGLQMERKLKEKVQIKVEQEETVKNETEPEFITLEHCSSAYVELQRELEELRKKVAENNGSLCSGMMIQVNGTRNSSLIVEPVQNISTSVETTSSSTPVIK